MLADCVSRSQTSFGSTSPTVPNPFTPVMSQDFVSGAALSDVAFHNWNRFFLIYCDGMIH
jgi:hypothetical protein